MVSDGYDQVKLIGVGKSQWMSSLGNWTNGNDVSVCADVPPYPIWNDWSALQRDLYVLDHEGNVVFHENITNATNWGNSSNANWLDLRNFIEDLISQIPGDCDPDLMCGQAITCCDGLLFPTTCCSLNCDESIGECGELGDLSGDGIVNVLDVVAMVNLVLSGGYNEVADMNGDGTLNVLDVVLLVGIILN